MLVDDHTVVRQGLRRILEADDGIQVVGEASDGRRAAEMAERLRPHVVVMDVSLPELNGIEATRQVVKRSEGTKVLILSMHLDEVCVRESLKAGARGYLVKDSEDLDLVKAVKMLGQGRSYFSPTVSQMLLEGYVSDPAAPRTEDNLGLLTDREREVLQLIAEGKTNKEIAVRLDVSVNTVETHRKHTMEKLDLHNTAEVVRFALRKKIVE
jgi:two-component system, NarL family, response regulator NreC